MRRTAGDRMHGAVVAPNTPTPACVRTVVEELAERGGRFSPASLLAVDGVHRVVKEHRQAAQHEKPPREGLIQVGGVQGDHDVVKHAREGADGGHEVRREPLHDHTQSPPHGHTARTQQRGHVPRAAVSHRTPRKGSRSCRTESSRR